MTEFTETDYNVLLQLYYGGDISKASKSDLERYSVMLCRPNAYTYFGNSSYPQLCDTVRTLLIVRMSEEQNEQAKRESRIALVVAWMALGIGSIQAVIAAVGYFYPSPIEVQASTPLPVHEVAATPACVAQTESTPRKPATAKPAQRQSVQSSR